MLTKKIQPQLIIFLAIATSFFSLAKENQIAAQSLLTDTPVAKAVATGGEHACAIYNNAGQVYCWGNNDHGQLGSGNNTSLTRPEVAVGGALSSLVTKKIVAGFSHTCVIAGVAANSSSDRVYCWGANDEGQLGNGDTTDSNVPVAAIGALGSLEVTDIYAGFTTTCAQVVDGTVYCWGANDEGQFGNNNNTSSNVPVVTTGWTYLDDLAIGMSHTCGVSNGTVSCAGAGADGQLGNGANGDSLTPVTVTGITGTVVKVSVGYFYSCALTEDGKFYCWGDDTNDQLGGGGNTNTATELKNYSGVVAIASGYAHSCAGSECIGENGSGQLGDGTAISKSAMTPVVTNGVLDGLVIKSVSAGFDFTCWIAGVAENILYDEIYCAGADDSGQLGNYDLLNSLVPVTVDITEVDPQEPYISLSINDASYDLLVTPGNAGASESKILTVITNNSTGYNLNIKADQVNIISTTDPTAFFAPQSASGALETNAWGYGVGSSEPNTWTGVTMSDVVIDTANSATTGTGTEIELWVGAKADYSLPTGEYQGTIIITAVVNSGYLPPLDPLNPGVGS